MAGSIPSAAPVQLRLFVLQLVIACFVLAGGNVLIARMAKNSVPRQLIDSIDHCPDATFLASGNSLMAAAFDAQLFRSAIGPVSQNTVPLNIALGATGPVEQLLLLRHAMAQIHSVKTIVYGFFDLQLTERPTGEWADLVGNRAMSYYVEPYFAADLYAPASRFHLFQNLLVGHVPMLVERLALWAKVEKMRRAMEEVGLPHENSSSFGRANDFKAMEFSDVARFDQICQQCADERLPLTPSVQLMIDLARLRHADFVMVKMPMQSNHRQIYYDTTPWHAYEDHLKEICLSDGVTFIDAGKWLQDEDFADDLHANAKGAAEFTKRLAAELKPMLAGK